ncbi:DarT ssDNA thymidine ADP-ribosyltransferase family protein [Cronobacter dublinensis]
MEFPASLKGRYAYHFTCLHNLESIIENGLLCTNLKNEQNITHHNVAEHGIQGRRSTMQVPCSNGNFVHDYVPFYFSKRNSMQLAVINKKNVDQAFLIYFAIPLEIIVKNTGAVFSDASANTDVPPKFYNSNSLNMLNSLNWDAIDSKKWSCPSEIYRHQKMAELLVPGSINISELDHIIVWNRWIKDKVVEVFKNKGIQPPKIRYSEDHYYTNFYDGKRKSIVTGPYFLKKAMEETIEKIHKTDNKINKFRSLRDALDAIEKKFSSIKELDDIDGLKASYWPHTDDVGRHSRKVAGALEEFNEYNGLSDADKEIVLISAYLHDIGKGPKSRWGQDGMTKADNDHAAKSLPMLERILTEDIGGLSEESVRKIVTLVTYDDLIGDIVAKGRDEKQLIDIIKNENDLKMLIALSKADMNAINPEWVTIHNKSIADLESRVLRVIRSNSIC